MESGCKVSGHRAGKAVPAISHLKPTDDDRGGERYRVRFNAVQRDRGQEPQELTVLNVSASGILLATKARLAPGASIGVHLPIGLKDATIIWKSDELHGAQFCEPLSAAELQQVTAVSRVTWPSFRTEALPGRSDRATAASAEPLNTSSVDEVNPERLPVPTNGPVQPALRPWLRRLLTLLRVR